MGYQYGDEPTFNLSKAAQWLGALNKYTTEADGYFNKASNANKKTKPPKNGDRNKPVRPSQPNGEPTAYAQHSGTTYYQLPDGRDVYQTTGGIVYDRATGQQVVLSERTGESGVHDGAFSVKPGGYRAYKGSNLRNEDNQVIEKGTQVWKVSDSNGGGGGNRDNSRVVPGSGGIVQKGTDMGRSFNDLLKGVKQQPFGGSQLPTTMGNPYTATYKQTQGFGDEIPDIGGYNGVKFDSEGGRNAINSTNLQDQAPLSFSAPFIEGGSERIAQQATGITSGRLSDALDSVREQEAGREMTPERRQQMARAAFLNADGPMSGLKARDAVLGKVYAGGKYYISGESGDDQAIAIEDYQARDMNTGKTTANALLAEHIAKNKGNATPAETQEPPTIEKPGIKQSFGRTETISTPIDTSIPDTTAFNINNGVDVPAFGNRGGYKPMSKKSEVDYSSIFSY